MFYIWRYNYEGQMEILGENVKKLVKIYVRYMTFKVHIILYLNVEKNRSKSTSRIKKVNKKVRSFKLFLHLIKRANKKLFT